MSKHVLRFTADWCGPCKVYGPIFDKVVASKNGITSQVVDLEKEPELAEKYKVMAIPATVVLQDGKEVDRSVGVMPAGALHKLLDNS